VHEILAATTMHVSCLVRHGATTDARSRVIAAMRAEGLWEQHFDNRLDAFAGDLAQPGLGLSAAAWNYLAAQCDVLLHNGALVNFLYDYRAHRRPNVLGTREVLRLAMAHHAKPVHHMSTLGILNTETVHQMSYRDRSPMPETVDVFSVSPPAIGYSQSKLLAEHILLDAARHGAQIAIYRLGEIMPGNDGRPNRRALTHLLLTAFARLGACPDVPMRSDYTPVDYTARRIIAGIRDRHTWGQVLHVFHPESVDYTKVVENLQPVSGLEFLARLDAADPTDRELHTLRGMLKPETKDEIGVRQLFAGLIADSTRLFRRDHCQELERRWELAQESLAAQIAAYRKHLGELCITAH
jgi:thioester reductase-like protein